VVAFKKVDQVPGMTPDAMPAIAATRWMHVVLMVAATSSAKWQVAMMATSPGCTM